jgi:hypothetical protein
MGLDADDRPGPPHVCEPGTNYKTISGRLVPCAEKTSNVR